MTRLSRMKLSVHLTRHSSTPAFLIFRSRHTLATLGNAAATSMRTAPAMNNPPFPRLLDLRYGHSYRVDGRPLRPATILARVEASPSLAVTANVRKSIRSGNPFRK